MTRGERAFVVVAIVALLFLLPVTAVNLKAGVTIDGLTDGMRRGLDIIDSVHKRLFGIDVTVTSGTDGTHAENSDHYTGNAVDVRTRDLSDEDKSLFSRSISTALGPDYWVYVESDHIHVSYRPK